QFDRHSVQAQGAFFDCDPRLSYAFIEFGNGATASVTPLGGCDVVIGGTQGTITVESDGHRLRIRTSDGQDPYWRLESGCGDEASVRPEGTRAAIDRLVAALRGERTPAMEQDKSAIISSQRILFACAQSYLHGGVAVNPQDIDPALSIAGRTG